MKTSQNFNIYIITSDELYGQTLKDFLKTKLDDTIMVQLFTTVQSCINEMGSWEIKPDMIILDYSLNETFKNNTNGLDAIEHIKNISPDTMISIISDKNEMDTAIKTLRFADCNFVNKDQFLFSHLLNSIQECLQPAKL